MGLYEKEKSKRLKQDEKTRRYILDRIEAIDDKIKIKKYVSEMRQIQKEEDDSFEYWKQSKDFLQHLAKTKPYKIYLIGFDLVHHDRYSIRNDLYRGKITIEDVGTIIDESKHYITVKNDFSIDMYTTKTA